MSAVSDLGNSVGTGVDIGGRVLGLGPKAKIKPYNVNQSQFQDPNLAANQALLAQKQQGVTAAGAPATGNVADLIAQLKAQAAGQGPSVAQAQLAQTTDANRRAALGAVATAAPGGNPALNLRNAINAGTNATQTAAGQAATLRAGEVASAQQLEGGAITTQGTQAMQQQQLIQQYVSQGLSLDEAQFAANQDLQKLLSNNYNAANGLQLTNQGQQQQQTASGIGAVGGLIAALKEGGPVRKGSNMPMMKVRKAAATVDDGAIDHYADGGVVMGPAHPALGAPTRLTVAGADDPNGMIRDLLSRSAPKADLTKAGSEIGTGLRSLFTSQPTSNGVNSTGVGQAPGGYADGGPVDDDANPERGLVAALNQRRADKTDGGPINGPGGPKDDLVPAMLSDNENVWSADDVQNAGGQQGVEKLKRMLGTSGDHGSLSAVLAAAASLHHRMKAGEGKRGR